MKGLILFSIIVSFAFTIYEMNTLKKDIEALNRETQVHWMLPPKAECAIKVMYFRNKNNIKYPADRMVCHWTMK